jgi:hypothetical protein
MSDVSLSCPHGRTRTLPSEFQRRTPLAVLRLRSVAVDQLLEDHHRVRHAEHCGGRRNDPALVAAQGLCPRSFDVVLRPSRPGLPKPKIHSARGARPQGRCMNFLTAPSSGRPPLSIPVRGLLGVRHAEHREKTIGGEVNSARSEFAREPSNGHSRRRAQRGRAAKNSLLSQREHH